MSPPSMFTSARLGCSVVTGNGHRTSKGGNCLTSATFTLLGRSLFRPVRLWANMNFFNILLLLFRLSFFIFSIPLGCGAASAGESVMVSAMRVEKSGVLHWAFRPLKVIPLLLVETSATKHPVTRRNIPERRRPEPHRCESLRIRLYCAYRNVVVRCPVCHVDTVFEFWWLQAVNRRGILRKLLYRDLRWYRKPTCFRQAKRRYEVKELEPVVGLRHLMAAARFLLCTDIASGHTCVRFVSRNTMFSLYVITRMVFV